MTFEAWLVFMAIWIAASIPLGPNALNCISTSAAHGFARGLFSVAGVFIAAIIHITLALSGLAAFMSANPALFEVLRWCGVAYLAWMGLSLLRSTGQVKVMAATTNGRGGPLVLWAILISLSNPKAIFGWLAIFSQFIDHSAPLAAQLFVLAPSALSVTLMVYVGYCAVGLGVSRLFGRRRKRWFDRITGSIYLAFTLGLGSVDMRKA